MVNTDSAPAYRKLLFVTIFVAALAAIAITALLVNIFEHKQEARNPFYRVVELNDTIDDPRSGARTSRCNTTST
jgi:nitrite reductase (cytochrome c-552)